MALIWMPIDTAPRDGRPVLARGATGPEVTPTVVHWARQPYDRMGWRPLIGGRHPYDDSDPFWIGAATLTEWARIDGYDEPVAPYY